MIKYYCPKCKTHILADNVFDPAETNKHLTDEVKKELQPTHEFMWKNGTTWYNVSHRVIKTIG
jgi:hypothetical protein